MWSACGTSQVTPVPLLLIDLNVDRCMIPAHDVLKNMFWNIMAKIPKINKSESLKIPRNHQANQH